MTNSRLEFEVCTNGMQSALNAEKGNVNRIELCDLLEEGGITPSADVIQEAREKLSLQIFVLVRPRAGNFFYSREEFKIMKDQIDSCKELNVDGVVTGMLTPDLDVDSLRCKQLVELAKPCSITFHRAFDEVRNPFTALEEIISLGFDRILTSGQKSTCLEGSEIISQLVKQARGRISIMAGAGITEENIAEVVKRTHTNEFHFSAKKKLSDGSFVSDLNSIRKIKEIAEKTFYSKE